MHLSTAGCCAVHDVTLAVHLLEGNQRTAHCAGRALPGHEQQRAHVTRDADSNRQHLACIGCAVCHHLRAAVLQCGPMTTVGLLKGDASNCAVAYQLPKQRTTPGGSASIHCVTTAVTATALMLWCCEGCRELATHSQTDTTISDCTTELPEHQPTAAPPLKHACPLASLHNGPAQWLVGIHVLMIRKALQQLCRKSSLLSHSLGSTLCTLQAHASIQYHISQQCSLHHHIISNKNNSQTVHALRQVTQKAALVDSTRTNQGVDYVSILVACCHNAARTVTYGAAVHTTERCFMMWPLPAV